MASSTSPAPGKEGTQSTVPSLTSLAFKEVCHQLEAFVVGKKASASFVCGGLVPNDTKSTAGSTSAQTISVSPPVRICWRTDGDNIPRVLTLPLDLNADSKSAPDDLHKLVVDCDPASFGKGQKDVIDPQYRKAGKLEPHHFFTSFHPSDFGILQNVEQILLPNFNTKSQNSLPFRKLSSELYKLNVYSGPSGLFRQHVDTPRSQNQIGSLVVCLPSHFKGGNLVVRHEGKQVVFDWSYQSTSTIQWAAFYSDCEHEIKTITEGERITLTYNLYVTEPVGGSIPPSLIVDPKSLSLHSFLKELFIEPSFMKEGGAFGFYCSHAYPHTSDEASMLLPRALKGADLVLYSVFKSLGIQIDVVPVIIEDDYQGDDDEEDDYEEDDSSPFDNEQGASQKEQGASQKGQVRVGDKLHSYKATGMMTEDGESSLQALNWTWSGKRRPEVTWIGSPTHEKMALTHLAYGNETSQSTVYSYAAIIAEIPPFQERKGLVDA
ncbi:Oxoglutarate/iron-dependent dioxygenase [Penicillium expansum]|uniref:Oxoglutarate/iron-dependent dioxygenase n=1 Tax=Penicillium expansum TaxID=27334 RepID=A0A0A2JIP7_PENEN|nr:Oxoglutarate/iron-dependent dioxygenase [Penicillium expansum]KGO55244.1 Oxoglutarate/iron-dependent dioxygenase [Penicillium expansum]KGO73451.1 Oxoglutarate/iron-dependent dioxygenase [Penicillium expansum]